MTDLTKLIELQAAAPGKTQLQDFLVKVEMAKNKYETSEDVDDFTNYLSICAVSSQYIEMAYAYYGAARNFDFAALDEKIKRYEEALRFIANGCLVPPDGGSPVWPDDAIEAARKALEQ